MHKLMQFFYRFSLYFTAVIAGILLAMSMVCMYGYKEYLSGGLLLSGSALLRRRAAEHLDGYVSGLGVPLPVLLSAFPPGQLAGAERDLNF